MVKQFYVARDNKRLGPFSAAQLRRFASDGLLRPTDTVWKEGMKAPVPAAKVKNLFPPPAADVSAPAESVPVPPSEAGDLQPLVDDAAVEPESSAPSLAQVASAGPSPKAMTAPHGPTSPASPLPLRASDHERERRAVANENPLSRPPAPARKRQAFALSGAILISQDGVTVHYRKKCSQCGCEDRCRSSMLIGNGIVRSHFFCPKCRKNREVQLRGTMM
jgi:hypothetical protein